MLIQRPLAWSKTIFISDSPRFARTGPDPTDPVDMAGLSVSFFLEPNQRFRMPPTSEPLLPASELSSAGAAGAGALAAGLPMPKSSMDMATAGWPRCACCGWPRFGMLCWCSRPGGDLADCTGACHCIGGWTPGTKC